jgi:hypothetical protein
MMKRGKMRLFISAWLLLVALLWPSGEAVAGESKPVTLDQKELLQVKVYQLIVDPTTQQPVVFLTDRSEKRALLIWIGPFEANAILSEIQGQSNQRPLTHDLLGRIIRKTQGNISRIVITHLKGSVYYAKIEMERESSHIEIDARPSDSIVMALKFKAPIFVSRKLFKDMAVPLKEVRDIEGHYGVTMQDLTPSLIQSFSFGTTEGVLISNVLKGSQAEKDGIERGDIFVEIGGRAIEDITVMKDVLTKSKIAVQAKIFRSAHFISITLHPN